MLTQIKLGNQRLSGVSVGGVYTSLWMPQLDTIFDAGVAPRSFVGAGHLLLSHGHADHIGALPALIGVRGLSRQPAPRTFLPAEIIDDIKMGLDAFNRGQHRQLAVDWVGVSPGDEFELFGDLHTRVFRTKHSVPSVGYELFHRVNKLRPEFLQLGPQEIQARRKAGEALFYQEERSEVAYATDTLVDVLDENPSLYRSRVLILECTFLDGRKSTKDARAKSHIHLDEVLERADLFENEHLVLMHFSQIYQPHEVHQILKQRLPERLASRVRTFAPKNGPWPG